jgi:hypothetical protein
MSPNERRLAVELLRVAAEEFSNHGCNDFKRPEWFPRDEWDAMNRAYHERNGDPEEARSSDYSMSDFVLMGHIANRLAEPPEEQDGEE